MVNGKDKETDVDSVVKSQAMRSFVIPAPHQVRDKLQPAAQALAPRAGIQYL